MPSGDVMTLEAAVAWIDAAVGGSSSARRRDGWFPVILAEDGTWHRPMTTLELAVLQGLPVMVAGKPLQLAGKSNGKHRERIGNAVPVGAGMAIAESLLVALVAAKLGTWTLGSTGIWVRQDGAEEDVVNAPYEAEDPVYA